MSYKEELFSSNISILVARVKTETQHRYAGQTGQVLGWGLGDTFNTSCVLRKTSLIVYRPGSCAAFAAFRLFCAGYPEGKHDACSVIAIILFIHAVRISSNFLYYTLKGDSGGPFQVINSRGKYELIGICVYIAYWVYQSKEYARSIIIMRNIFRNCIILWNSLRRRRVTWSLHRRAFCIRMDLRGSFSGLHVLLEMNNKNFE